MAHIEVLLDDLVKVIKLVLEDQGTLKSKEPSHCL